VAFVVPLSGPPLAWLLQRCDDGFHSDARELQRAPKRPAGPFFPIHPVRKL
jgi:hypothetical protein